MELKPSISKAEVYLFECKANRLIVISPMIDARARQAGERLDIEMFGDSMWLESLENR